MVHGTDSSIAALTHPFLLLCFFTAWITIHYYLSRLITRRPMQWWPLPVIATPLLALTLTTHLAAWQVLSLYLSTTIFLSIALIVVYLVSLPVTAIALVVSLLFSTAHIAGGTTGTVLPADYYLWRLHLVATVAAVGRLLTVRHRYIRHPPQSAIDDIADDTEDEIKIWTDQ